MCTLTMPRTTSTLRHHHLPLDRPQRQHDQPSAANHLHSGVPAIATTKCVKIQNTRTRTSRREQQHKANIISHPPQESCQLGQCGTVQGLCCASQTAASGRQPLPRDQRAPGKLTAALTANARALHFRAGQGGGTTRTVSTRSSRLCLYAVVRASSHA